MVTWAYAEKIKYTIYDGNKLNFINQIMIIWRLNKLVRYVEKNHKIFHWFNDSKTGKFTLQNSDSILKIKTRKNRKLIILQRKDYKVSNDMIIF